MAPSAHSTASCPCTGCELCVMASPRWREETRRHTRDPHAPDEVMDPCTHTQNTLCHRSCPSQSLSRCAMPYASRIALWPCVAHGAPAPRLASCPPRCSQQGYTTTFLLRFHRDQAQRGQLQWGGHLGWHRIDI